MLATVVGLLVTLIPDGEIALVDPNGIVIRESGTPWYPNAHNFDDELRTWNQGTHTSTHCQRLAFNVTEMDEYIEASNILRSIEARDKNDLFFYRFAKVP